MTQPTGEVAVEWDEPGAGGIYIGGKRVINFNIDTDWSAHWFPQVNEVALRFMDALPRLVWEREEAYRFLAEREEADKAACIQIAEVSS